MILYNGEQTIYKVMLNNAMLHKVPYKPNPNTTLNEKFNILPSLSPDINDYPFINLLVIGNGIPSTYKGERINLKKTQHSPLDGALFNHIPFYLEEVNKIEDNPPSPKLRLRKNLVIDGKDYIAYYGYKFDKPIFSENIFKLDNIDKNYANVSVVETIKYPILNPILREDIDLTNLPNEYLFSLTRIYVFLTQKELQDIKNAMDILNIDSYYLTEMGVCFSRPIIDNEREEMYDTQIAFFLACEIDLEKSIIDGKLDFYIETGGMEILGT